jgi:D-inositol-3-phosphate glycosyltransferase
VQRVAVISLHTSPLAQPGSGDSGGMNVYVRELVSALAQGGATCTTFTRADRPGLPEVVEIEPGHRVVHIAAGPAELTKDQLPSVVDEFTDRVLEHLDGDHPADVLHANYWLSGLVAHRIKHERDLPFVVTFHTLARVKAEGGDIEPLWRDRSEAAIVGCADAICVSCSEEERQFRRLYGDPRGSIEIVAPGVEHAFFAPGARLGARAALGLDPRRPVLLFVGRIQPLKGLDVAVRALAAMHHDDAHLLVVGGASGHGGDREVERIHRLARALGVEGRITLVPPQPHHILSTYYRAADAVVVPSRSESFGLVALEASACGIPVVASGVGGLLTLVDHGESGYLVPDRDPAQFAAHLDHLLDHPDLATEFGAAGARRAQRYRWSLAAARLRRVYADARTRDLVACR